MISVRSQVQILLPRLYVVKSRVSRDGNPYFFEHLRIDPAENFLTGILRKNGCSHSCGTPIQQIPIEKTYSAK